MLRFFLIMFALLSSAHAFAPTATAATGTAFGLLPLKATDSANDGADIVARRITVKGKAVQGGYYRSCVLNEAGKFRRLVGTMSPPDLNSDEAEIYVEGKQKMVDGFIRWCERGNVGLNQQASVSAVLEEDPTGMYDEFYAKTK